MDGRVLAFTLLISLATGLICGLMPALQSRRAAPFDILKAEGRSVAGSRGRIRAQQVLVAAEIAMYDFAMIRAPPPIAAARTRARPVSLPRWPILRAITGATASAHVLWGVFGTSYLLFATEDLGLVRRRVFPEDAVTAVVVRVVDRSAVIMGGVTAANLPHVLRNSRRSKSHLSGVSTMLRLTSGVGRAGRFDR
jgi:hypothetical protein